MLQRLTILVVSVLTFGILTPLAVAQDTNLAESQVLRDGSPDDDIPGLDPMGAGVTSSQPMKRAIFEGLVRYNFEHVAPDTMEPALAERWTVSDDGTVWTFYLRQGVQFHKGYGEFTAEDVKFSVERQLKNNSADAVNFAGVEEINILDKYTVEFVLKQPDAFFLYNVGNISGGFIVSKKAVEEMGAEGFARSPIGTGPFQFSEWIPKETVVLTRNEDYWRGTPILERIEFIFMPDINTRSLALMQGEIDTMTSGVDSDEWIAQMESQGVQVDILGFDLPMLLHFNMTVEPLDDLRVRKALAHAINRQVFIEFHGPSITEIQYSPLPPKMFGAIGSSEGLPNYEYDLEKARQLLAEAGYPDGFDLGEVISSVRPLYLDPLTIIQGQWAKIGVTFDIKTVPHAQFHALIRQDLNPIVMYPGPRPNPDMVFTQYLHSDSIVGTPTGVTNFSHYGAVDADGDGEMDNIDALIEEAGATLDSEKQKALYAKAQIKVMEDLPVFPLRVLAGVQARKPYVDLGHPLYQGSYMNGYTYTHETRILEH